MYLYLHQNKYKYIMSDIGKRFREFVDYKRGGESYSKFAERLDMSNQRMNNLFNGIQFGIKVIDVLMRKFPELNIRWLVLGEGEMLLKEYKTKEEEKIRADLSFRIKEIESLIPHLPYSKLMQINSCGLLSGKEIEEIKGKINTQNSTYNS